MSSKRRSSSRLASASNGPQVKQEVVNTPKRRKVEVKPLPVKKKSHNDKIVDFLVDYNLSINELFQLKEYGSVVDWNPSDFSGTKPNKPELFEHFLKESKYGLKWINEENINLDDLPLRLQKKALAEREVKLLEKYPFKDEVVEKSKINEDNIIRQLDGEDIIDIPVKKSSVKTSPVKTSPVKSVPKMKIKQEPSKVKKQQSINPEIVGYDEEGEPVIRKQDSDIDDDDAILTDLEYPLNPESHHKLKDIKFKIKEPKITHPSHIPGWKPPEGDNMNDEENQKIIDFNPLPVEIITDKKGEHIADKVGERLSKFLENELKYAITEDGTEYNNTMTEYKEVLHQQMDLFKKLYEKTRFEKSLELNGDKIEKRKLALPQSNARQVADPFRATSSVVPKSHGISSSTHIDNLLAQGSNFARIHQQVRKQRQARIKKIANMVDAHFKWKKGEKEREAKEREQNLRKISRLAVQAVKKRWTQAYKVYKYLQDQKEEELKKIKGREHLSHMLEHSTQLLEAQLKPSENESEDSDNMSDSEVSVDDTMDDQLSVEKLREKYGNLKELNDTNASSVSDDSDDDSDNDNDSDNDSDDDSDSEPKGLSALYGDVEISEADMSGVETSATPDILEYTDEQKALIEDLNGDDNEELAEDSDSSIPDDTTDSESESSSSDEAAPQSSLASLFNPAKESDDESVDDESMAVDSDDEQMSSTDEEDEPKTPKSDSLIEKHSELPEQEVNGSKVRDVPIPSLLRGNLRPYQKQGLNWLASLYSNDTNGILADEMGLGKTIQTISLLAHLATEYHIWGPHLIIVPTSVMLNWEMEFKKFAPGFKVLTYYGSPQQRAQKRKGWNKPDAFHVCITSYQLVVHDHSSFKRRRWKYMILDEAHNIKNFRSTRWKALLNFNTENRLLLTGTPLQNNLMELWSLLYFLMPSSKVNQAMPDGFANLEDFQQWFGRPVDNILEQASSKGGDIIDENESTVKGMDEETRNTVARLHQVLRPYILRRLKKDVEKQMPGKYEHIVYCRLSQRQRYLYDDFMSRAKTKETLASGSFLSIINCLMQLRKVCNHPDLFEVRPIVTSFAVPTSVPGHYKPLESLIQKLLISDDKFQKVSFDTLNLDLTSKDGMNKFVAQSTNSLKSTHSIREQVEELDKLIAMEAESTGDNSCLDYYINLKKSQQISLKEHLEQSIYLNDLRCEREPIYGDSFLNFLRSATIPKRPIKNLVIDELITPLDKRLDMMNSTIENYSVITPKVVTLDMKENMFPVDVRDKVISENLDNPFHKSQVKLSIAFPDKSLLQYDCGKLQMLDKLLQQLTSEGHRALIFTQMTKVLDILEQFLNIHGYRYSRLDGSTKIEDRQLLTEKFNRDPKIPVFILSSRSGGLGINLTGADTVIFYDSDWNPAMDKQCQDRCHRIGQSRDVHIYRFVSEHTIESNILRKANQKRQLDNVVIQEGDFTTDYFGKFSVRDIVDDSKLATEIPDKPLATGNIENALMQAEDEDDRAAASAAMKETAVDDNDFNEDPNAGNKGDNDDMDYDEGVGHVDEYMLRYIANGYYE
ncbi:helicase Swr1p [[Candida] jaroonii]|uniref:Helicase Swr1p n=1 Tax=[Candida] jaroonii TaxID=467808 RepID=A0ACA9Y595_9ASCO|nr:helicase Swr1p [[Candida] jaroonii]